MATKLQFIYTLFDKMKPYIYTYLTIFYLKAYFIKTNFLVHSATLAINVTKILSAETQNIGKLTFWYKLR